MDEHEDVHFYIDNAPPDEVSYVFRILSADTALTPSEIAASAQRDYGYSTQKDTSYSPRRLYDLGLAYRRQEQGKTYYSLSECGVRLQSLLTAEPDLFGDVLHYLHFTRFNVLSGCVEARSVRTMTARKHLWSYRRCCQLIWEARGLTDPKTIAAIILGEIPSVFPTANLNASKGGRFNSTAVSCVYTWLRSLQPTPVGKPGELLCPRQMQRHELAILALDDLYRARSYRYGDAVLLTDELLDQVAGVFFLDRDCCATLLRAAAKISAHIRLTDTLAGPSINLLHPYTVEDL